MSYLDAYLIQTIFPNGSPGDGFTLILDLVEISQQTGLLTQASRLSRLLVFTPSCDTKTFFFPDTRVSYDWKVILIMKTKSYSCSRLQTF